MVELLEMPLDEQLRDAIAQSGLSANQLARELKISQPTVSRFLAGNDIKFSVAVKMADYFGLELTPRQEEKPTKKAPRK